MGKKVKALTWADRLQNAKKNGTFTDEDRQRAYDWRTCAIGEAVPVKYVETGPTVEQFTDPNKAKRLGMSFLFNVSEDNIADAEQNWKDIKKLRLK